MGLSKNQKITPKCCKKVQEKQTVFLAYHSDNLEEYEKMWEDGEEKKGPNERKKMYEKYRPVWVTGHWNSEFRCWGMVKIKFCPHCSRSVPKIERRKTARKICSVTDGGSYCDTCKKRLRECTCYRPEYAWKPGETENEL